MQQGWPFLLPLVVTQAAATLLFLLLFSTLAAAHGVFFDVFPQQTRFIRFSHTVGFCSLSTLAHGSRTRSHSGRFRSQRFCTRFWHAVAFWQVLLPALLHTVLVCGRFLAGFALSAFAHGSRTRSLFGSFRSQRFCTRFSHTVAFMQLSLSQRFRTWFSHAVAFLQLSLSALLHTVLAHGRFFATFTLSTFAHGSCMWSLFCSFHCHGALGHGCLFAVLYKRSLFCCLLAHAIMILSMSTAPYT